MLYTAETDMTLYNNWDLNPQEYLKFLVHENNVVIAEAKNAGHDNLTIGYERYKHVVTLNLEKI